MNLEESRALLTAAGSVWQFPLYLGETWTSSVDVAKRLGLSTKAINQLLDAHSDLRPASYRLENKWNLHRDDIVLFVAWFYDNREKGVLGPASEQ